MPDNFYTSSSSFSEALELAAEEDVDLVIMSAHGHGGARWMYGSVALNYIAYGAAPVLIMQDMAEDMLEKTQAQVAAIQVQGH